MGKNFNVMQLGVSFNPRSVRNLSVAQYINAETASAYPLLDDSMRSERFVT